MPSEVTRRRLERWLLHNGFALKAGGRTSHRQFQGHGVTVTLPGHGPPDLTKKHVGMIVRLLEQAGFDRATLLSEIKLQGVRGDRPALADDGDQREGAPRTP